MDQQWRRQWQAIETEEASRMDPLQGLAGRREGPVPPLSDLAISEDQDSKMRQQRREEKQTAAMQAAIKTAEANKAAEAMGRPSTSQGRPSFGIAAELVNDDIMHLPLPPAQRPGSVPIVIPTALAMATTTASATPDRSLPIGNSRRDMDVASSLPDQDLGRASMAQKSISAAVGGAVIDMFHENRGGETQLQKKSTEIKQAVGQAALDELQRNRDRGVEGQASSNKAAVLRQGEQPRPSAELGGTKGVIGAAALSLLQDQAGAGPGARLSLEPGASAAIGSALLDELKDQRAMSTSQSLQQQKQTPSHPEAQSLSGAVGAAVLDVLHDQSGRPLPRQRSQPGVEAALGAVVLDDLQVG